jgi:rhodanese-related sulfurtransferase
MNEFVEVRAPGAMLVPTSSFVARLDELPADRPLLVICHLGNRSAAVTGYLARMGRDDVFNVAGGMEAWARAGLPVRRGQLESGEGDLPAD